MKFLGTIFILVFVVNRIVYASEDGDLKVENVISVNSTLCNTNKCIMKCCPFGKFLNVPRLCTSFDNLNKTVADLTKDIFKDYPAQKINITVKAGIFEANKTIMNDAMDVTSIFKVFPDYPSIKLEQPNAYNRWTVIPNDQFCWEYKFKQSNKCFELRFFALNNYYPSQLEETTWTNTVLQTAGMMVTCFFLLLVLVVYSVLPELRNLCGRILMSYLAMQMTAFFLLAILRMKTHSLTACLGLTFVTYYCFMASFCWMHVMSYDIWWTFRGYAKVSHHRGENFKFLMYCLYAFGVPLCLTTALIILNEIDMSDKPWFVTPKIPTKGCFISGGEKLLYLYMPMLILILCNWMFYLMTAYNVWRLSRGTAVLDSAAARTNQAHRTQRQRFMVYVKLSAVMGLNWVFEVASYFYPDNKILFITDFFNSFIGVILFFIFVCKRKILRKLTKRYLQHTTEWKQGQRKSIKNSSSASDSTSSQETQNLQVCTYPEGPGYPTTSV